jgi:hypothetical protein
MFYILQVALPRRLSNEERPLKGSRMKLCPGRNVRRGPHKAIQDVLNARVQDPLCHQPPHGKSVPQTYELRIDVSTFSSDGGMTVSTVKVQFPGKKAWTCLYDRARRHIGVPPRVEGDKGPRFHFLEEEVAQALLERHPA